MKIKRTAYLDNNIFVDIEQNHITINELVRNIDEEINQFFYSASHLQEALEMTANSNQQLDLRITKRLNTISSVTKNNYIFRELPSNNVLKLIENPAIVYETIKDIPFAQSAMKSMMNTVSEEQKTIFRQHLGIDIKKINNYNPKEVIEHINSKNGLLEGYSFLEVIEKAIDLHPDGKKMSLNNRFGGVFEFLDMLGYWKDKHNNKSNYARLWDANHCYFSSYCDYFISDDKRTRNKAKVAFELYGKKTKVLSSQGKE